MKSNKLIATTVLSVAMLSICHAKGSSHPVSSDVASMNTSSAACMVAINTEKTTRFLNVNAVRYVEVNNDEPAQLVISLLGNHQQGTMMKINYSSKEQAMSAMKTFVVNINKCSTQ